MLDVGSILFLLGWFGFVFAVVLFLEALAVLSWERYKKYRMGVRRERRRKHFK